jgi:voltage-gated potassium channel
MQIPIILAAVLPLIIVPESGGWVGAVVGIVSWLVFLADYIFNERRRIHYTRTWLGRFDLAVVVLTSPWYLIPGVGGGSVVVLLRLARIARVVMASRGARRLIDRLGRVAIVALGVLVVCSAVAYHAEHPTNTEFATFGDSLWWGIVTLTTVGYGDIVPKTAAGRWAGVVIMLTGVAVLGVLAGSLASFFRIAPAPTPESDESAGSEVDHDPQDPERQTDIETLTREIAELRSQMEQLSGLLTEHRAAEPRPPPGV